MKTAEEILVQMIELFQEYLDEIQSATKCDDDFFYGEKTAYVECLEIIQQWYHAKQNGLNYNIEEKYPLL